MTPIIEKFIDKVSFQKVIESLKRSKEFEKVFVDYLDHFLTELEEDKAIEDRDDPKSLMDVPIYYINAYTELREQGFSKTWSNERANQITMWDTRNYVYRCYVEVSGQDKDLALSDLQIYCKFQGGDKLYTDFLIDHVINGGSWEKSAHDTALEFCDVYNNQIAEGKSEIYARQYAEQLIIYENHEIFCEDYAYIYDQSIKEGKNTEYAHAYADRYGELLVDIKRRYGIHDDRGQLDYAKEKAKGYINAWEYARDNEMKNSTFFIERYISYYTNALHPDNPDEFISIADCESKALQKALEDHQKRKGI